MVADGIQKDARHQPTQLVGIAVPEGFEDRPPVHFQHGIREPRGDGLGEDLPHFLVGDDEEGLLAILHSAAGRKLFFRGLGQVARQIKEAPEIFFGRVQRVVGQAFDDLRRNTAAIDECLELLADIQISSTDKTSDDGVAAGIVPVGLRLGLRIVAQVVHISTVHASTPPPPCSTSLSSAGYSSRLLTAGTEWKTTSDALFPFPNNHCDSSKLGTNSQSVGIGVGINFFKNFIHSKNS